MTPIMSTYLYSLFPFTETLNQWTTEEIEPQLRTISPIQKECEAYTTHSKSQILEFTKAISLTQQIHHEIPDTSYLFQP